MQRRCLTVLALGLLAGLLVVAGNGCGPASPTPAPTEAASPVATPAGTDDAAFVSPLFTSPLAAPPTLEPVPTPAADKGTVTGVLILAGGTDQPMASAILYLGEIIKLADGRPAMAGLDKQKAPSALTNAAGQFIFRDVAPGEYTLVYDLVLSSFVLEDPSSGGDFMISAAAGQITDLGELRYYDLPGSKRPGSGD